MNLHDLVLIKYHKHFGVSSGGSSKHSFTRIYTGPLSIAMSLTRYTEIYGNYTLHFSTGDTLTRYTEIYGDYTLHFSTGDTLTRYTEIYGDYTLHFSTGDKKSENGKSVLVSCTCTFFVASLQVELRSNCAYVCHDKCHLFPIHVGPMCHHR